MKIWDLYILRTFISYLIVFLVGFVLLFILVDLIDNLDKFIDNKAKLVDIIKYYGLFLPYIAIFVLPIASVTSCGVCCGISSRNREIISLENSGITRARASKPIIFSGILLSIIVLFLVNLVIPNANKSRNRFKAERIMKRKGLSKRAIENVIYQGEKGVLVFISQFDPQQNAGKGVSIQIFDENRLKERYDSDRFHFSGNNIILEKGFKRIFTENSESIAVFDKFVMKLKLPSEIFEKQLSSEEMTTPKLLEFIRKTRSWGFIPLRELVDLYIRFSFPFANLILLLLTSQISLKLRKYSIFSGLGYSFLISFLYYSAVRAGQALGYDGAFSPLFAALAPTIIFFISGLILYLKPD